ncbi:MAG TPA: GxxExxY protein [Alphaproteobacteria bacterium]|nr:GxxExxY protein [Alphaproteobacteria bacterium]
MSASLVEPSAEADATAKQIVDSAYRVHMTLGPGLLESVYETCLVHELTTRAIPIARQVAVPIWYGKLILDGGLRLDLIVDKQVVVELKAVDRLLPVHQAQMLTYLKLSGLRLGLLINFNVGRIKDGIQRFVRGA